MDNLLQAEKLLGQRRLKNKLIGSINPEKQAGPPNVDFLILVRSRFEGSYPVE